MNTQSKPSIRRTFRLIQGIVGLQLIFLLVQAVVLWTMCGQGARATSGLLAGGLPSLRHMASLRENLVAYRLRSYELMFAQENERPAKATQADALDRQNRELLGKLKALFPDGDGAALAASFETSLNNYVQAVGRMRGQLDKDFTAAMQMLDKDIPPLVAALDKAAGLFADHCASFSSDSANRTVERFGTIRASVWGLGSASIGFALLAQILVTLSSGRIQKALVHLVEGLSGTTSQVHGSASLVAEASQSLAEGAGKQAASIEETSASLEEMASMTRRNAESAKGAKEMAGESRGAADEGARTMRAMSTSMEQIQASGQAMRNAMMDVKAANNEVSKIIKTIDEIAFQTNILALNAAVEAARAGEAGLGFAVVADEVRSLAQKCALAARDTAGRIESAIDRSERGTRLSQEMASNLETVAEQARLMEVSLKGIMDKTLQVDSMVADIAAASLEQKQGIEQVNLAVSEMDTITQTNAASAQESASASANLRSQAAALLEIVAEVTQLAGKSRSIDSMPQPGFASTRLEPQAPALPASGCNGPAKPASRGRAPFADAITRKAFDGMEESFKDF